MTETQPPYDGRSLTRHTDPRVARVAAFLFMSWDRCVQLPFDVLMAADVARARHERALKDAWDDGYQRAHAEMSEVAGGGDDGTVRS